MCVACRAAGMGTVADPTPCRKSGHCALFAGGSAVCHALVCLGVARICALVIRWPTPDLACRAARRSPWSSGLLRQRSRSDARVANACALAGVLATRSMHCYTSAGDCSIWPGHGVSRQGSPKSSDRACRVTAFHLRSQSIGRECWGTRRLARSKCRLIRGWDELFSQLDEHLQSMQSMKMSPWLCPCGAASTRRRVGARRTLHEPAWPAYTPPIVRTSIAERSSKNEGRLRSRK